MPKPMREICDLLSIKEERLVFLMGCSFERRSFKGSPDFKGPPEVFVTSPDGVERCSLAAFMEMLEERHQLNLELAPKCRRFML